MTEFFKGWRRKAGCVTLVMATVLGALWIRSCVLSEFVSNGGAQLWCVASFDGGIHLWSAHTIPGAFPFSPYIIVPHGRAGILLIEHLDLIVRYEDGYKWTVPYWQLTIPLALTSVYLLLWNARQLNAIARSGREGSAKV